jgi:hypothetical protein
MITKLEQNTIKSMLNRKLNTDLMAVSADKTTMKINRGVNKILEFFLEQYKIQTKNDRIGKSAYLHALLKQFAQDQPALLRYGEYNTGVFTGPAMLPALQEFKRVVHDWVDPAIKSQSEAVLALLLYSSTRSYEVKNDLKTTDYRDDEYESDMEEQNQIAPIVLPPVIMPSHLNIEDLFEESDLKLEIPAGRTP